MLPTLGCSSGVPHEDLMEEKYAGSLSPFHDFYFFFSPVSLFVKSTRKGKKNIQVIF